MRLDGGRRHTSSFQAGFRLTEDGNKTQSYHTWSFLNNTPNCFKHFRASLPATHLWRQWWEWWRCRWRGTGSLPSCWESTNIKKSHSAAEDHINNVHIYKTDWPHVNSCDHTTMHFTDSLHTLRNKTTSLCGCCLCFTANGWKPPCLFKTPHWLLLAPHVLFCSGPVCISRGNQSSVCNSMTLTSQANEHRTFNNMSKTPWWCLLCSWKHLK